MLWIVLSVFDVQRGAFGVSGAARAAGRAYALAPNDAVGQARAEQAARQALADQGLRDAAGERDGHLYAVPRQLPPGDLDDHGPRRHPGRPATAAGGARRQAPSFALDASHTVPIGQYQEVDRASQ